MSEVGFSPVTRDVLRSQWRGLLPWAVALVSVSCMYIAFYPSIGGAELDQMIENLPESMVTALGYDQIGTAAGYVDSTVYALLGPILLSVFVVLKAGSLVAGDEEAGVLELDLAAPVARSQLLLGRLVALWLFVTTLLAVLGLAATVLVRALGLDIGVVGMAAATIGLWLYVLAVGTVTAAAGALSGRRSVSVGVGAGVAVLAFVLNAIGPTVGADWMTTISPFSWYSSEMPLLNGIDPAGYTALVVLTAAATVVAIAGYDRRDLMV